MCLLIKLMGIMEVSIINSYKACKFLQSVNNFVAGFKYQYPCQCRFKQSCAH